MFSIGLEKSAKVNTMDGILIALGIVLIVLGFVIVAAGTLKGTELKARGGVVLLLGPLPVVLATDRDSALVVVAMAVVFLLWLWLLLKL